MREWQNEAIDKISEAVRFQGARVLNSVPYLSGTLPGLAADLLTLREQIAIFGAEQLRAEMDRQEKTA